MLLIPARSWERVYGCVGGSGYGYATGGGYGNSDDGSSDSGGAGVGGEWNTGESGDGWGHGDSRRRWFLTSIADDFATQVYLTRVNPLVTTGTLRRARSAECTRTRSFT